MSLPLRLQPSAAVKEKRLAALLDAQGLRTDDPGLVGIVEDAQLLGSLELAGLRFTWDEVRSTRVSGEGPGEIVALRRARGAVAADAPLDVGAIRTWHEALAGPVGFRRAGHQRDGAPTAPAGLVESRLATLGDWLETVGTRDLQPEQAAALALARLVEILPFDDANGRVSRLAASHLMVRGGMRPPILVAGDAPRLRASLEAAFRLETEPLVALLVEASGRALDVMIQSLSAR
jgi:hypothetical protein